MLGQNNNVIAKQVSFFHLLVIFFAFFLSSCGGSGSSSNGNSTLSVSGLISVQADSDIDLDLNQSASSNDELVEAQLILNPSLVGGYLSGYSGVYSVSGSTFYQDQTDVFQAALVADQQIQLNVFQADESLASINIELALLDENQNEVDAFQLTDFSSGILTVPTSGTFFIRLTVDTSTVPLLYTLSLSKTFASSMLTQSEHHALTQDFVPGEVLVKMKSLQKSISSIPLSRTQTHGLNSQFSALIKRYHSSNVVALNVPSSTTLSTQFVKSNEPAAIQKSLTELEKKLATLAFIKTLKQNPDYEYVEPNYLFRTTASSNDPKLPEQWNLQMLAASAAWEVSSGSGVTVAVLDTGINPFHEDLVNQLALDGFDFISDSSSAGDGDGLDTNPTDLGSSFHGSHVAGIIAAEANNEAGISGLAYNAKILPLRVIGVQDTGSSADIAEAILYAAGLPNASGRLPAQRADIINMSFGAESLSQTVSDAISAAYEQGVIMVAAAGNSASNVAFYPAAFNQVVGVGAVSNDKKKSSFSNFGVNVNLVAPGGTGSGSSSFDGFQDAIISTISGDNYAEYIGTSMAAPHVAAVAALMKEVNTNLNAQTFNEAVSQGVLTDTLTDPGEDIVNYFGAGLINAAKAVNWAAGEIIIPGILSIYPQRFGFSGSTNKAELSLKNYGNESLNIISIEENESWLQVTPKTLENNATGLGVYLIEVNLGLINFGQGKLTVSYQIDAGPIQVEELRISVFRSNQNDATVGTLFVSLYREEDLLTAQPEPRYTVGANLNNGAYSFQFDQVVPGRYLLSASTDNDGDQQAGDPGEATGAYPIQSRPEIIEINNRSLSNLDFLIQFPTSLTQTSMSFDSSAIYKDLYVNDGLVPAP